MWSRCFVISGPSGKALTPLVVGYMGICSLDCCQETLHAPNHFIIILFYLHFFWEESLLLPCLSRSYCCVDRASCAPFFPAWGPPSVCSRWGPEMLEHKGSEIWNAEKSRNMESYLLSPTPSPKAQRTSQRHDTQTSVLLKGWPGLFGFHHQEGSMQKWATILHRTWTVSLTSSLSHKAIEQSGL